VDHYLAYYSSAFAGSAQYGLVTDAY
jgi:hypothetical protein